MKGNIALSAGAAALIGCVLHARGGAIDLSSPPNASVKPGTVGGYFESPDGNWTTFWMSGVGSSNTQLVSRRTDGSGPAVRLSDDASTHFSGIGGSVISPDGQFVVYRSAGLGQTGYELYSRPIDGSGNVARLTDTYPSNNFANPYLIRPNNEVISFRKSSSLVPDMLRRGPIDGSTATQQLTPNFTSVANFTGFDLTPDGNRVLFTANGVSNTQLISLDLTSGAAPAVLNDPGKIDPADFQTTADSKVAVFFNQENGVIGRFFSRPVDGSAVPIALSSSEAWSSVRQQPAITPDMKSLVYSSSANSTQGVKLYISALDGSVVERKLSDFPVSNFHVTADGSRVVYLADTVSDQLLGFDSVLSQPLTGGSATQLYKVPNTSSSIFDFTVSPDVKKALFLDKTHLYEVSTDTANSVSTLFVATGSLQSLKSFLVTPDSKYAVVAYNETLDTAFESLWAVPLDGSKPWQLSDPLPNDGDIYDYQISPDGHWVLYRASDSTPGEIELFAAPIPEPTGASVLAIGALALGLLKRRRGPSRSNTA
ncbi:MAG TPA: hypothetical protein VH107_15230 [Lacipirellulaceae bacterium]|nr:hypothetical protein [Lacipirellulaceae bacterium]